MLIGIIPTFREIHINQIELCVDRRLIKFLQQIFYKPKIKIISEGYTLKNEKLIISCGGNTLNNFSKKKFDILRGKLEANIINQSIKKKIKYIGLCYGAQFLAKKFGCKIKKIRDHVVKEHKIKFESKSYSVNSFHNYAIIDSKSHSKKVEVLAKAQDKTIECYKIKDHNLYGVMWHPERHLKIKKIDKRIFKLICN